MGNYRSPTPLLCSLASSLLCLAELKVARPKQAPPWKTGRTLCRSDVHFTHRVSLYLESNTMSLFGKLFGLIAVGAIGLYGMQALANHSSHATAAPCCCGDTCPCEACDCSGTSCTNCECVACDCPNCECDRCTSKACCKKQDCCDKKSADTLAG